MEVLDQNAQKAIEGAADVGAISPDPSGSNGTSRSKGSSVLDSNFDEAIDQNLSSLDPKQAGSSTSTGSALDAQETQSESGKMGTCQFAGTSLCTCSQTQNPTVENPLDEHDHAPDVTGNRTTHVSLEGLQAAKTLDASKLTQSSARKLLDRAVFSKGDVLDSGAGANDVTIGSRSNDVIFGDKGGINTITTGTGRDAIVFGKETTNRIFDFDASLDRIVLADGLTVDDIMIVQGTNPGRGGVNQPLDSNNNTLIIDKSNGHILGSLAFTKAETLTERNFGTISTEELEAFRADPRLDTLFQRQQGDGQLNGSRNRDVMVGGDGSDFLYVGDDGFKFNTTRGGGNTEFPFPTDSPGTSQLRLELKGGVLKMNGSYKNFDGFPLFSQGEREIDPNARILNGSNPQALIDGFLRVPQDVEGNPITGFHLHYSPAGDSRGNFADATVIRYIETTPTNAKSGTFKGEFELTPEEQAALLGGTMYMNMHTNLDGDGDGRAGFPTGENRLNINRSSVKFI